MKRQGIFGEANHLVLNADVKWNLVGKLKLIDDKTRRILIIYNISILLLYLSIIVKILKVYAAFNIHHSLNLTALLCLIYSVFVIFIWVQWKHRGYKPTSSNIVIKEYFYYQLHTCNMEIKLLLGYLITYLLITISSFAIFSYDINDWSKILPTIVTPIGLLIFTASLFYLLKQIYERKKLIKYIRVIDIRMLDKFSKQ